MPAIYTHSLFVKDVYKVINNDIKDKIDIDLFNVFGNSFDVLFFSNYKLGSYAHSHNVNAYFKNMINNIITCDLTQNKDVKAYLYGSICHYVLDSTIHPYVYYKTGKYNKKKKETRKYKGKHSDMETMIDAILYKERNNKDIYKVKLAKEVFPKINYSNELKLIINKTYLDTFNINNGFKYVKNGIKNYKFILKYIMCSRFGIKYYLFKFIDIFNLFRFKISSECYYIKKLDYKVLNLEHKKWYYPVDKKISYHYSFYDLYDVAIEKARCLINEIDSSLNDKDKLKSVVKNIGNNGYGTGKNCNRKYVMKYFEY